MELDLLRYFLPEELLNYFDITKVEKAIDETLNRDVLRIYLDEKNELRSVEDTLRFESKGFLPVKQIQDFPIRGKAVFLCIRMRRWRNKTEPSYIVQNDYSFIADGAKLTNEIVAFLKSTGRDPSRYH
jgi:hypothetical protein